MRLWEINRWELSEYLQSKAKNAILNLKLFYRVGEISLDISDLFPNMHAVSAKLRDSEVLISQYIVHVANCFQYMLRGGFYSETSKISQVVLNMIDFFFFLN